MKVIKTAVIEMDNDELEMLHAVLQYAADKLAADIRAGADLRVNYRQRGDRMIEFAERVMSET